MLSDIRSPNLTALSGQVLNAQLDTAVAANLAHTPHEFSMHGEYRWIDRAFWGRGVATEALSAFLCLEPNPAAIRGGGEA